MEMSRIMGIIMSVIVVIVGLVMFPLVLTQTNTAATNEYVATFAGVGAIVGLIPLLYAVGVLGLAGWLAMSALRRSG
jgi:hypothetical protein